MLTLKEKLEALARGEKLRHRTYVQVYIHIVDDKVVDFQGQDATLEHLDLYTSIYQPPVLKLGPEHVGKRVRMRDGSIGMIGAYICSLTAPIVVANTSFNTDGKCVTDESRYDIVEVLE